METEKLKYQKLLEQFPDCPGNEFEEVEKEAYRWVHKPLTDTDFLPVNIISEPPPRMLDDSDKMCRGYGLSMFDTFEDALGKYKKIFKKLRSHQRVQFKEGKGNYIALLALTKDMGIADEPNERNYGHFTFYEYANTDLQKNVSDLNEIFKENGEFVDK